MSGQSYADHKKIIGDAAYKWVIRDWGQGYNSFFDMLLETENDWWMLPSYFVCRSMEKTFQMSELGMLLRSTIGFPELLQKYAEETQQELVKFVPHDNKLSAVFHAYNKIQKLSKDDRSNYEIRKIVEKVLLESCRFSAEEIDEIVSLLQSSTV